MKARRIYRKYSDPSFPLHVMRYAPMRIMSNFGHIHWHPEPELLYATAGEYEIYDEKGSFHLHTGEVCLIPTGKAHAIRSLSTNGEYWCISFSMELISMSDNHFFQQQLAGPMKAGSLILPDKIRPSDQAAKDLDAIIHGTRDQQFIGLMSFWLEMLPHCKLNPKTHQLNHSHGAVEACIRYMDVNYSSHITLAQLAAHVHLHPNYLCAIFKQHSGQTILDYLNTLRIRKARQLLNRGNLSITQVAEQVGFNDTDHFSRTFKSLTGISPSAFKKTYSEN